VIISGVYVIAKAAFLGFVQGATEFLPVSSSGHLVIIGALVGLPQTGIAFEVAVHLATTLAVIAVFRRRVWAVLLGFFRLLGGINRIASLVREDRDVRWAAGIIVGTFPAVAVGLLFESKIEIVFTRPFLAALFLSFTGVVLLLTALARRGESRVNTSRALVVGCAQALAILPGVSRSGMTIATGLFLRVKPESAAEFSFLLSIPAILGAGVIKSIEAANEGLGGIPATAYLAGAAVAFAVGYASLVWLMRVVRRGRFAYFGMYCVVVGVSAVIYFP
jgi:undecaprenyl-diphosphatase